MQDKPAASRKKFVLLRNRTHPVDPARGSTGRHGKGTPSIFNSGRTEADRGSYNFKRLASRCGGPSEFLCEHGFSY